MSEYNGTITSKITEYLKTKKIMGMITKWKDYEYSIAKDKQIGFDNLLSIILYTDYTDLSANFTSTFRKKWIYESLEQTKRRNRKYYWWSRILQETIEMYGDGRYERTDKNGYRYGGELKGPFFTGMSKLMKMPQFMIHLISPTSTSLHIEVAMRFAGDYGSIIEFDNRGGADCTQGFSCRWLSRYAEEDEVYVCYLSLYVKYKYLIYYLFII